jgi:DNA-directed RNA polymerase specialized sigma subunit
MTNTAKKTDNKEVKPKRKKNYLNNKDMMAELGKCHEQGKMTDEFAKMIMLLAERYGSRYEYSDYSPHIEDMKSVAVANVVRAWRSFDLEKYNNPFAYFTQAIKHTFWQYVSQEKKHRLNRDAILISQGELPVHPSPLPCNNP